MASYYSIAAFKREYTKIGTAFKQLAMTFNMDTNEGERSMLRHFFFYFGKKGDVSISWQVLQFHVSMRYQGVFFQKWMLGGNTVTCSLWCCVYVMGSVVRHITPWCCGLRVLQSILCSCCSLQAVDSSYWSYRRCLQWHWYSLWKTGELPVSGSWKQCTAQLKTLKLHLVSRHVWRVCMVFT